jgi:hypothetical protein
VRVIAVSESPSARDGQIVEQGVFYYLTLDIGEELIRVLEAGAAAIQAERTNGTPGP